MIASCIAFQLPIRVCSGTEGRDYLVSPGLTIYPLPTVWTSRRLLAVPVVAFVHFPFLSTISAVNTHKNHAAVSLCRNAASVYQTVKRISASVNGVIILIWQAQKKIAVLVRFIAVIYKFPVCLRCPRWVYNNSPVLQPFYTVFNAPWLFVAPVAPQAALAHIAYAFRLGTVCRYKLSACVRFARQCYIPQTHSCVIALCFDFICKLMI